MFHQFYFNYSLGVLFGAYLIYAYPGYFQGEYESYICFGCGLVMILSTLLLSRKFSQFVSVWLPRALLAVALLLAWLPSVITWRPFATVRSGIQRQVQRQPLIPMKIEYARTSDDILRVLHLDELPLLQGNSSFNEFWYEIMNDTDNLKLHSIMQSLFGMLPCTLEESYDLLWLLIIADNPHGARLSKTQLQAIARASTSQLRSLLPGDYPGPTDRVSLIFSLMSSSYPRREIRSLRYQAVRGYRAAVVYHLTFNTLIDDEGASYSQAGPYAALSMLEESPLEVTMKEINANNVNEYAKRWGLTETLAKQRPGEELDALRRELSSYDSVLKRRGKPAFPKLEGKTIVETNKALSDFTNQELLQHYEPRSEWKNRKELIHAIYEDVNGGPLWSLCSVSHCQNEDTMNVLSGELHLETNKHDPENPTLSFGNWRDYRCYQVDELTASFADYDGIFMFRVPDWVPGATFAREFSIDSIRKLHKLVEGRPGFAPLFLKITQGLRTLKDARQRIHVLKTQFDAFSAKQQDVARLYLAWMFSYGMWMRFWKGPGFPWPVRGIAHDVSVHDRDAHVIIQDLVRSRIVEQFEKDEDLRRWVLDLPVIYLDLTSNDPATCAAHTVASVIQQINEGSYCMGFGSDTILKSAFYYLSECLGYREGKRFNDFMNEQLLLLLRLEDQVLPNVRSRELQNIVDFRQRVIAHGFDRQPGFTSYDFRNNRHT